MSSSPTGSSGVSGIGGDAKSGTSLIGGATSTPAAASTVGKLASGGGSAANSAMLMQLLRLLSMQKGGPV